MPFLEQLFGGGVGKLVRDVVGTFHLSPQAQKEFEEQIAVRAHELALKDKELEFKLMDLQTKEIEAASANIRAEAQSGDTYTSRARPTFLYLIYCVLAWNYMLIPIIQLAKGQPPAPINLPGDLITLFGMGYLGYVHSRGREKAGGSGGLW